MKFRNIAAWAAACLALVSAQAGPGTYGFGTQAYKYGYDGGQLAYHGYQLESNGTTQAAAGWAYYGFTWASYALAEASPVKAATYYQNAQNSYDKSIALLAGYNAQNATANEQLDAALVHLQIARSFCSYAALGF